LLCPTHPEVKRTFGTTVKADAARGAPDENSPEKRRTAMATGNIRWHTGVEEARKEARDQRKLILVDLFNPG
jgi:hypothetical protein